MSEALLIYIPVLHQGYLHFLARHPRADILLLGPDLLAAYKPLRKDIRALTPAMVAELLATQFPQQKIAIVEKDELADLSYDHYVAPEDELVRALAEEYLPEGAVSYENVFLRWDATHALTAEMPVPDSVVSTSEIDQQMMQLATLQTDLSPDWWRQVGAVLVREGQVLLTAHNHYVPDTQQAYYEGDPRANFQKGVLLELGVAMHAEAEIMAAAAKQGIATAGCHLYVTTFPCPACARLLAYSGISRLYYRDGYSLVHGAELLNSQGIEIIQVV